MGNNGSKTAPRRRKSSSSDASVANGSTGGMPRGSRVLRKPESAGALSATNTAGPSSNRGSISGPSGGSGAGMGSSPSGSGSGNTGPAAVAGVPGTGTGMSRRSSSHDLPPSMVQMAPKSPILRNSAYASSAHSINNYSESAITDDEETDVGHSSFSVRHLQPHQSERRTGSASSGSSRRKSDKDDGYTPDLGRTNSHASSGGGPSRRSSFGSSGTNTAYSTPLQSPAIMNNQAQDYWNSKSPVINPQENVMSNNNSLDKSRSSTYPNEDLILDELNLDINNSGNTNSASNKKRKPIDIDETIQKLLDAGYAAKRTKNVCLKNSEIAQICEKAREIFLAQPALLELSPSVKIVGDVHGQYADLLRLFTKCGFPPAANYLFLGDYVDRGKQSLETILLLLCYKIKYPENFFLLRGNHECANVTRVYGFYDECKRRCNIKTWKTFIDTFNTLPLAAIVTGKIFCVHGGLSPVLNSMDEIRHVSRPTDVPDFGLINDLLWSDPTDSPNEWEDNERGVSYCYNKVAINKFLNKFGFDLVCRAHMVVEDGYEFFNDRSLVTVFSAPNYCGEFDNWGAVMSVSEGLLCSFELLDPLDSTALKQVMKRGRQERKLANQKQIQN